MRTHIQRARTWFYEGPYRELVETATFRPRMYVAIVGVGIGLANAGFISLLLHYADGRGWSDGLGSGFAPFVGWTGSSIFVAWTRSRYRSGGANQGAP